MTEESLFYKESDDIIFLRAEGHITASLCSDLKKTVLNRFDETPPVKHFFIDLSHCDYMDSTFMGLLVGFNKKLSITAAQKVEIVNPSEPCKKLLKGLGIQKLLSYIDEEIAMPLDMVQISKTAKATAEFILKAHEELINLSIINRRRFAALQSVLKDHRK